MNCPKCGAILEEDAIIFMCCRNLLMSKANW
jgi:hypothetical protein